MANQHLHPSTGSVRLRPEAVPIPKLAQHINLFLDSQESHSPFKNIEMSGLSPYGDPFRRIVVWGASGVGKVKSLERVVEAFGPDRALLVSGAALASPAGMQAAVELLRRAKASGELAVLAITDFDDPGTEGVAPLFAPVDSADTTDDPPGCAHGVDTSLPSGAARDSDFDRPDLGHGSAADSPDPYEAVMRMHTGGRDRKAANLAAISALQGVRGRTRSGSQLGASRLLEAIKAEAVPALVICSTSSYLADATALADIKDLFDLIFYAPLPSFAAMQTIWDEALRVLPLADDVDTVELASFSEGFTARDIHAIVRGAIGEAYAAQNRPLGELVIGQADLLAQVAARRPRLAMWVDAADPRRGDPPWIRSDRQQRSPSAIPVVAADLERVRRGAETREFLVPEALRQAALGELSASTADGAKGGWDSLLNGGLH